MKNAIIVAATIGEPGAQAQHFDQELAARWPVPRAFSRARCIDRPASVATPSSQPVAMASAITPNASAFSVRAASDGDDERHRLAGNVGRALQDAMRAATSFDYESRKQFHVRKALDRGAAANREFTPKPAERMH